MQEPGMMPKQCYCATCDAEDNPYGWRSRMCVCPVCGDKRCPAAIHHNNQCRDKESMATSDQWKMVSVEPTEEMLATVANVESATSNLAKGIYQTMLTAAPQPAEQQPAPDVATQILKLIEDECKYWHGRDEVRRGGYAILLANAKELISKQQPAPDVARLAEALESLLDMQDEDCRYDHQGYCQNHNLDHVEDGCRVARAKAALAAHRKQGGEE